jgi:hypothetical protein
MQTNGGKDERNIVFLRMTLVLKNRMENEMIILKDIIVTDLLSYMYIIGKTRQIRNDHFTLEGCLVFRFFSVANYLEKRNLHEICKIEIIF